MCKDIKDSILSGSLSYITGLVLLSTYKREYIWLGLFILVIGTIQWIDALIWYFKSKNQPTLNLTKHGTIPVLALQPVFAYFGYVYYSGKNFIPLDILYIVSSLYIYYTWIKKCKETSITKDGYLKWCNIDFTNIISMTIFIILLLFPFIYFPDLFLRNIIFGTVIALWIYNFNHEAFGSRWCYSFFVCDIIILLRLATK